MEADRVIAQALREFPILFAQDATSEQVFERYFGRITANAAAPNARRLCLEQLLLAVHDITRTSINARTYKQDAREWVGRRGGGWSAQPDITSFDGCCEVLGLDPSPLRTALLAYTDFTRIRTARTRRPSEAVAVRPKRRKAQPKRPRVIVLLPRRRGRPPNIVVAMAAG